MFGIGLPEMIVIMAVALVVVGPDKLPELARSVAKGVNELKKTMNQVKDSLSEETRVISSVQEDLKKTTGALAESLINEDSKIWRPEDDLPPQQDTDENIIDLQPLEERPWEKDASTQSQEAENQDDTDVSATQTPTTHNSIPPEEPPSTKV